MIWQLLQVGYLQDRPLVLLGDMWHGLIEWMRKEMISRGTLNPDELAIPTVVESIEHAVKIIKGSKEKWDEAMHTIGGATSKKLGVQ